MPLRFPAFNKKILKQPLTTVNDDVGRIQVLVSQVLPQEACVPEIRALSPIASFIFQPAPMQYLQASGISWPSPLTFSFATTPQSNLVAQPKPVFDPACSDEHRRDSGIAMSSTRPKKPTEGRSQPRLLGPLNIGMANQHQQPRPGMISSAAPANTGGVHQSQQLRQGTLSSAALVNRAASDSSATSSEAPVRPAGETRAETQALSAMLPGLPSTRMPDDQMNQLLDAIKAMLTRALAEGHKKPSEERKEVTLPATTSVAMPTPPRTSQTPLMPQPSAIRGNERRTPTDITMHMSCTAFPECTVEDPQSGGLVHKTPRKEGPESDSDESVIVVRNTRRGPVAVTSDAGEREVKRMKRARSPEGSSGAGQAVITRNKYTSKRKVSRTASSKGANNSFTVG